MQSGYSMNCFRIVIEINRKDTGDNLFSIEEAGDVIYSQLSYQFIALLIAGGKSSS
jgi:hypothetical protein